MSEKASTAMKSAKTIQYIIHRTWGGGGAQKGGGGQRLVPEPAEPTHCPGLIQPSDAREPVLLHSPGTWMALERCP